MSARVIGIGLLSFGGLAVGATGGYLAFRPDVPASAEVQAAPAGPTAHNEVPPDPAPVAEMSPAVPVVEPVARPVSKAVRPRMLTPRANPRGTATSASVAETDPASAVTAATAPAPQVPASPVPDPAVTTAAIEAPRYPAEPQPTASAFPQDSRRVEFEELTVAKRSVIGIRLDAPVSTRTARLEDRVTATVSRDVNVAGRTAIAAGVRLEGSVVAVERGGRFKTRPRLGLQFDRMILADGTRVNIKTDTIYREGDSPTADATAKVGTGAVAGAILGAVIGGKKGAAIGTAAGAAGGVATVMRGESNEASLPGGAPLTVRLADDVAILINR